jgi:inorganic triphosphatase YgiF
MHGTAPLPRKEIEITLDVPPTSLKGLKKLFLLRDAKDTPARTTELCVYFDTDKLKLRNNGVTLRVRKAGDRYIQTIETINDLRLLEGEEWEVEVAGQEPDLTLTSGTALEPLVNQKLARQLRPLFQTRVQRTLCPILDDTSSIVLRIDRGIVDAGRRSAPLCEIGIELERGNVGALFAVAREIARSVPARLAARSRSERGYALVADGEDAPVKAARIELPGGAIARDAFAAIGRACLKQVLANEHALIKGDGEGVHQMRVGLRRLRAGMSLFGDLLHDDQTSGIKAGLKWLAAELGPARELDVLVSRVVAPMSKERSHWSGMPSLSAELAQKRKAALLRAQNAVESARFRTLTVEVAAWIEAGRWRVPEDEIVRNCGECPAAVFAAKQLTRRWRKVRSKGRALPGLDADSRHKLRIQAKKLRYGAEFFAGLFPGKRATKRRKQLLLRLERLQDGLGDLNDIAVHERRIAAMGMRHPRSSLKRAFAAGLLTGREDARTGAAMAAAEKAFAALVKVKPFWR